MQLHTASAAPIELYTSFTLPTAAAAEGDLEVQKEIRKVAKTETVQYRDTTHILTE